MVRNANFQYPDAVVKFFYRNRGYSQLPDDEKFRLQQILLFWTLKDRAAWNNFLAGLIKQRICVKYLNDQALNGVISAARQSIAQKFGKKEVPFDPDVPACYYWTEKQCAQWIVESGFPEMKDAFLLNHITGRKLVTLDASALNKMGVRYFDKIKAITAKIREVLQIPRPNVMRAIMRMVPMERFLRKKVYRGRNYDVLTFKKFCENEGFPHSLLLRTSKTAELPMTCKTKFYLDPETITPVGSDEGSETISLFDAPSVEFIARTTLVRNKVIQGIIDEMLHNVMLPPGERKYGAVIYRTISEIIELAFADLGMEPGSKERMEFLEEIGKNLLEELQKTHEVLKDIQVTRKFIKKDISEDVYSDMKAAAEMLNEEVFPIAAMLGVGELDLESLFRSEPFYQDFVMEIAKEAEHMTNVLTPDASKLVDQVIMEAKLRLLLMMFPEMTLEDLKKDSGDELDEDRIEVFLSEGLEEHDKEKVTIEAMSKIAIIDEDDEASANYSEDLHLGPYRILAARKGSDLTWVEKLDSRTGNPDVSLLTEAEIDSMLEGKEFPTFDGTREITTELRNTVQEEKNNRLFRRRMAAKEIQRLARIRNTPGKRNEYGAFEEYAHEEKFFPDGTPILSHLTTEELETVIFKGVAINVDGGTTFLEEKDELRAGAKREVKKRKNMEALAQLQLDNYKRKFPGYLTASGEFHEYSTPEKQDLEGTPIVGRLDHLELRKLATAGVFNGTSYKHIPDLLEDAKYEMEKREHEEVQARLQQQIFQNKFPGKIVLGEHEEYTIQEKFTTDGEPVVDRFNDAELEGILESKQVRLLTGDLAPATSKVIKEARQERAKRDKMTYRARFQQQNFRQKYPRRSFAVLEERSKIFNIHQRYDSSGKPIFERLEDDELEEILEKYAEDGEENEETLRAKKEKQERVQDASVLKQRNLSVTDVSLHRLDKKKSQAPGGYFSAEDKRKSRKISAETARRQRVLHEIRDLVLTATKDKEPEPVDAALALFNGFLIDDVSNVVGTVRPTDGTIRDNTGEVIGRIAPDGVAILDEGLTELGRVGADVEQIGIGKFRALPKLIPPIEPDATYVGRAAPIGQKLKYAKRQPLPAWNKFVAQVKGGVLVKEGGTWVRKESSERYMYNKQLARQIQLTEDYPAEQVILVSSRESLVKPSTGEKSKDKEGHGAAALTKEVKDTTAGDTDSRKSQGDEPDEGMTKFKKFKPEEKRKREKREPRQVQSEKQVEEYEGPRGPREARGLLKHKSTDYVEGKTDEPRKHRSKITQSKAAQVTEIPGEGAEVPGEVSDDERASPRSSLRTSSSSSQGSDIQPADIRPAVSSHQDLQKVKSEAAVTFEEARKSVVSVPVPISGKWGKQKPPRGEEPQSNHAFKPPPPPQVLEAATTRRKESMDSAGGTDASEMMGKLASGEAKKLVNDSGKTIGDVTKEGNIIGPYGSVIGYVQPNGAVFRSDKTPWKGESVRIIRQNGIVVGRINSKGRLQVDRDKNRVKIGNVWSDGRIVNNDHTLVGIITNDGRIIGETGNAIALFTPTFEILGSNGLPYGYVSSEGKVFSYDIVPQLRYNPKTKTQEQDVRKTSIELAFEKAATYHEETKKEDEVEPKPRKSTLAVRRSTKSRVKVLDEKLEDKAQSLPKPAPADSTMIQSTMKEKERQKAIDEERLLWQYDQDETHKLAHPKTQNLNAASSAHSIKSLEKTISGIYSKEELDEYISKLKVASQTDHRQLSAQDLLLMEKQLHRRQLVENWAHELGDDDIPDNGEYWTVDPELSREEQLRACRMAADSILDDIFKLALTHLLLQAEAGDDTERVLECLASIQTTGNDEGLTMWQAHLEQLGEFGNALMKKVSDMLPEPGDNEVWRIVSEKAKQAKEHEDTSTGTGSSKDDDHHHHRHHHHHHHHHHHEQEHEQEHEHHHHVPGHEHHHHHHHHHKHSHKPDLVELDIDAKFQDPDYDHHHHHHHHRHTRKSSIIQQRKSFKPPVGPLGRVLETDEIEQMHKKRDRRLSNKLPELPNEFLYGSDAHKKSEIIKKREILHQQQQQQQQKLPHIPHPGVVAKGGLLQEIEREDVAEQIHRGKEQLAKFETKILPQKSLKRH